MEPLSQFCSIKHDAHPQQNHRPRQASPCRSTSVISSPETGTLHLSAVKARPGKQRCKPQRKQDRQQGSLPAPSPAQKETSGREFRHRHDNGNSVDQHVRKKLKIRNPVGKCPRAHQLGPSSPEENPGEKKPHKMQCPIHGSCDRPAAVHSSHPPLKTSTLRYPRRINAFATIALSSHSASEQ